MYISTSRKPSLTTKRLCRLLSRLLPRGIYENRGKKSVEEVAERARKLGKSRALLVYERSGNPDKMQFLDVGNGWEWLSPEVRIVKLPKLPELKNKINSLSLSGPLSSKLAHLFNFEEGEAEGSLELTDLQWSFYSGKVKVFSFGVSYGEIQVND